MNELNGFHEQFADCFHRSESREHFFNYMAGQFSELERKSIEPIALAIKDGNVRAMQRFVSDAQWDDNKILLPSIVIVLMTTSAALMGLSFSTRAVFLKKAKTRLVSAGNTVEPPER